MQKQTRTAPEMPKTFEKGRKSSLDHGLGRNLCKWQNTFGEEGFKNQKVYQRYILEAAVLPWAQKHFGNANSTRLYTSSQGQKDKSGARRIFQTYLKNGHTTRRIFNPMDCSVWSNLESRACTKPHKTLDSLKQSFVRECDRLKNEFRTNASMGRHIDEMSREFMTFPDKFEHPGYEIFHEEYSGAFSPDNKLPVRETSVEESQFGITGYAHTIGCIKGSFDAHLIQTNTVNGPTSDESGRPRTSTFQRQPDAHEQDQSRAINPPFMDRKFNRNFSSTEDMTGSSRAWITTDFLLPVGDEGIQELSPRLLDQIHFIPMR
ncbi:DDE_3 domain-containing protein [Trichonephila clavipes]|uniref:DDE_3 domain-containing protein n=1 Tax=Trichonephila clavipes TaxID=2585209 RepID=A0A8X6S7W6_TRICX|nr:DDE_3 domain-containing protein [Trichonephila clavipes]